MCNFDKQPQDTKAFIHLFMKKASQNIGGVNFLLSLIEAVKSKKPNPLISKECKISSDNTVLKWNKIIFKDKFEILEEILLLHKSSQGFDFNILENESSKKRKRILNMVKTLSPIKFTITPKDPNDGNGFDFGIFNAEKDDCVKINPIFTAMFFCSVDFTKKALKYQDTI